MIAELVLECSNYCWFEDHIGFNVIKDWEFDLSERITNKNWNRLWNGYI